VWVVDHDGFIRFANPAALAALGYDEFSELDGKPSHETIHYMHRDGSPFPAAECPMLRPRLTGEAIHVEDDWFVRSDGSMFPVEYWSSPIDTPAGPGAVVAFNDITERRAIDQVLRERDAILEALGQPVYVTDSAGLIEYANPAAVAALGFDDLSEIVGKNGHWLVHYKRRDGSPYPIEECQFTLARDRGEPVHEGEDWFVRKDGSMVLLAYTSAPITSSGGRGTVIAFSDVSERRAAESAAHARDVAEARAAQLAASEARQRAILEAALDGVISVDEAGRITYINPAAAQTFGYPAAQALGRELVELITPPADVLDRRMELTGRRADGSQFPAELSMTRIAAEAGPVLTAFLRDITDRKRAEAEQAALRHVATLVARGAPSTEVFDAVCQETGRLLEATNVNLAHFTPDGMNLTIAGWSMRQNHVPPGTRLPLEGDTINAVVRRTGAPARVESYEDATGELAELLRRLGILSEVASPVVVDGEVWGALIAGIDRPQPFPEAAESRIASFAELIGTAVSNATARAELIAARRRVIEAGDSARARLTRDLHDGAQQQFVNTVMNVQLARDKLPSEPSRARELLDLAVDAATVGIDGLRELAAGIHPEILTNRGLHAALDALAARLPLPVDLEVDTGRLPAALEASVYFFCSEALTNVVKHAHAESARVSVSREGDRLCVAVSDDGIGGAAPRAGGSGLVGLGDRVAALDGTFHISAPEAGGTLLEARIPLTD
jgi:PAS domain S-box-containing protein